MNNFDLMKYLQREEGILGVHIPNSAVPWLKHLMRCGIIEAKFYKHDEWKLVPPTSRIATSTNDRPAREVRHRLKPDETQTLG